MIQNSQEKEASHRGEVGRGLYNPDVLNCLANLSNDEVFTPPELANKMLDLLPQELFQNPNTTFLDPFTKSGVFLREIVKRLDKGLEKLIPNRQERIDHILQKQVFGIAITELTSLLARRSVYCSKDASGKYSISKFPTASGNILYKNIKHTWVNGKCKYCGASQAVYDRGSEAEQYAYMFIHTDNPKQFFPNMKFDVIVGNPPYQLDDGGFGASAKAIYPDFVLQAKALNPHFICMIIPARWYAGGKDVNSFRDAMLKDKRISSLHDFPNASECFPGVEIKGGVCYFLWKRERRGNVLVHTHKEGKITSILERPLIEPGCETFIRQNEAISVLHKVMRKNESTFDTIVHPAMTFGLRTFFKEFDSSKPQQGLIKVYAQKSIGYIYKNKVVSGTAYIDKWKVIIPEAIGSGEMGKDILKPIISEPFSINTETYIMNGPYSSRNEAENVVSYINTKFFHFLLGLKKITQHATQKVYALIPLQDFSHPWTDEMLYKKYGLTDDEIAFIESMIRPME